MSVVALSLGSNLGDRLTLLRKAVASLKKEGLVIKAASDVFETPPWGMENQPPFLNACIVAETGLSPKKLLELLKKLEGDLGRTAGRRWGPRIIDIDIIFYDDLVFNSDNLTIPHQHMAQRPFVLVPLAQAAPEWKHPATGLTAAEMSRELSEDERAPLVRIGKL